MKKVISFALLIILIISMIIGCSAGTESNKTEESTTNLQEETTTEEENAAKKIPDPKFTAYNLNGRAFNILVPVSGGWVNSRDFEYFPEMAGEPVNDAVQARIIVVEEMYNCVITPVYNGSIVSATRKEILSDGSAYDLILPALTEVSTLAGEGLLIDLYTIKPLNLEMPWWSQGANENLSIMGKLYYTLGNLTLIHNDGLGALIFSKKLVEDNDLTSPYEQVYNNTWTIDAFIGMCRGMTRDLDGDGKYTKNDQFGYLGDDTHMMSFVYYCDESLVKKDSNDIPYPSINSEKVIGIVDKVLSLFNDPTASGRTAVFGDHGAANAPFMNNQILFRGTSMFRTTQIREMESDFGFIVPPKYDEKQEKFFNIYSYASPGMAFPISILNADENGAVTEALAYYGRTLLLPAYFEINLQTKITRDEDSPIMLELIFDAATVDLGYVYNFGTMRDMFTKLANKSENIFVSEYDKIEAKILADIQKLVDTFS